MNDEIRTEGEGEGMGEGLEKEKSLPPSLPEPPG